MKECLRGHSGHRRIQRAGWYSDWKPNCWMGWISTFYGMIVRWEPCPETDPGLLDLEGGRCGD